MSGMKVVAADSRPKHWHDTHCVGLMNVSGPDVGRSVRVRATTDNEISRRGLTKCGWCVWNETRTVRVPEAVRS